MWTDGRKKMTKVLGAFSDYVKGTKMMWKTNCKSYEATTVNSNPTYRDLTSRVLVGIYWHFEIARNLHLQVRINLKVSSETSENFLRATITKQQSS